MQPAMQAVVIEQPQQHVNVTVSADPYPTTTKGGDNVMPTEPLGQCATSGCPLEAVWECYYKRKIELFSLCGARNITCGKNYCDSHAVKHKTYLETGSKNNK
jgi:hypothetical protein